jgi:SAM-dependent methyltransferase
VQLEDREYWDQQFDSDSYFIGTHPAEFLELCLSELEPGKILLPGEGEGRNAVYAAKRGWSVEAFDFCSIAKQKALHLARQNRVSIEYWIDRFDSFKPRSTSYDVVAVLDLPSPQNVRAAGLSLIRKLIKDNGTFIYEGFTEHHGSCWASKAELGQMFRTFQIEICQEYDVIRHHEGSDHCERVIRMVARKGSS